MPKIGRLVCLWLSTLALSASAVFGAAEAKLDKQTVRLWDDFNHYVRIARPDLAAAAGEALLDKVDDSQLLKIVESSPYRDTYQRKTLPTAERIDTVRDVARRLNLRIEKARIVLSRDRERIAADIELLTGTLRQRHNALQRLAAAGQFAAPQMLDVLIDHRQACLHPYVETAIVEIGRPLVYPLSEALRQLEPVQMGQVARALSQIGYQLALPYLKEVLEQRDLDDHARMVVRSGLDQLAARQSLPDDISAAELFLTLGQNFYGAGTSGAALPGYDVSAKKGIIWSYSTDTGLAATPVPAEIFADALCLRATRRALALQPQLNPALSLWLAANLRRQNRLPAGEIDHSHTLTLAPSFYASMAGPLRLHDVLDRALRDADADLAIDAINGLRDTAGTDALINREGTVQPLLRALSYPDRRVRFPASFVMTQTRPSEAFPGSDRVVTVLAEAVRQSDLVHVLVIGDDQLTLNRMMSDLKQLGHDVSGGLSLESVVDAINAGPGFDIILAGRLPAEQVETLYHQVTANYKLATVPILALVSVGDQYTLERKFKDDNRLTTAVQTQDTGELSAAIKASIKASAGRTIDEEAALHYASTALGLLQEIAVSANTVYDVKEAEPAAIQALQDRREPIVIAAAALLALIDSEQAQSAMATSALQESRSKKVQAAVLNSVADSAKQFGSKLPRFQLGQLLELVKTSEGEVALAAARAHGALTLPAENVVDLIVK